MHKENFHGRLNCAKWSGECKPTEIFS